MAQYRQSGADRFAFRNHHEPQGPSDNRIPYKSARIRRPAKPHRRRLPAAVVVVVTFTGVLFVTFLAFRRLSSDRGIAELGSRSNGTSGYAKELRFGHGSAGRVGRDSRYWDRDDRRRDRDYSEEDLPKEESGGKKDRILESRKGGNRKNLAGNGGGLYNEAGRKELDSYKEEYEASLKNGEQFDDDGLKDDDPADEYDDGIDVDDEYDVARKLGDDNEGGSEKGGLLDRRKKVSGELGGSVSGKKEEGRVHGNVAKLSGSEKKSGSKRKPKHHKFSSSTCEMKFLNSTAQLVEPVVNKKFSSFSLRYTEVEESPSGSEDWEPRFAGHQTLQEREKTYYAHDQTINCGFIKGPDGSPSTGFDITEDDMKYMSSCHIVLSSCIFGNSDRLRTPFGKTITRLSRKNVCFVMFLDQSTLETLSSEGQKTDSAGFIGLWKIIVIKNLPYNDMRRVGKIPKFLPHRLFPSARYSIWVDSKLRLQTDPILILEYFLWRHGHEYAISNHYARSCVSEEVLQNKRLNKYNHTVIDQQYEFYQADGLRKFDPSDPNKLLPSYVPEGSFIVRAHTPMSNLFSCLWFNEVDRFTPRDQLSFAYTYLKLRRMNPGKPFRLNMFKDCERRSIAKLFHHRAEEKRSNPTQLIR